VLSQKGQKSSKKSRSLSQRAKKTRKTKKKQKNKKPVAEVENYEFEDFAKKPENLNLLQNWFDFNDSTITPIKSGKLQKQFGGSNESAYILIYRKKSFSDPLVPNIPEY
jgi:hypothetical protein